MGQSSSSQPGKHPRPRGICDVGDLPSNVAAVVDHFSLDLKAYLENDAKFVQAGHDNHTTSTFTPNLFSLAGAEGALHNSSHAKDVEHEEYEVLASSKEEKVDHVAGESKGLMDSYPEAEPMDHGDSSSYDDMSYIAFYLNQHDESLIFESSENPSDGYEVKSFIRPRSSKRHAVYNPRGRSFLPRPPSLRKTSSITSRGSTEHLLSLKPSSAYLSSLRPSSSYRQSSRPSSSSKPLRAQRSDDTLFLSRKASSRTLATSSYASSIWSPTSEVNDNYRVALLTNLHYCTYGCKDKSFKRKLDWIRHEERFHEPPILYTCLLHISDTLESDPCPGEYCVSVMDSEHLNHYHDSFTCFAKPTLSIERYQTEKSDLLLEHLRTRHGLDLENFPDYWSSESNRKMKWHCGFCGGVLKSWRERADHVSIHFTREGAMMDEWKDEMVASLAQSAITIGEGRGLPRSMHKRLSVVKEF